MARTTHKNIEHRKRSWHRHSVLMKRLGIAVRFRFSHMNKGFIYERLSLTLTLCDFVWESKELSSHGNWLWSLTPKGPSNTNPQHFDISYLNMAALPCLSHQNYHFNGPLWLLFSCLDLTHADIFCTVYEAKLFVVTFIHLLLAGLAIT